MDKKGLRKVMPVNNDASVTQQPFLDLQSGYIQRAKGDIPQQGSKLPWKIYQNYSLDLAMFKSARFGDKNLEFK